MTAAYLIQVFVSILLFGILGVVIGTILDMMQYPKIHE